MNGDEMRSTRRTVLAGLGGLGPTAFGPTIGSASDTPTLGTTSAEESSLHGSSALEAFVDDVIAERIGDVTPGATVAVVHRDGPILVKGYGTADANAENPVRATETGFQIGSVGKLVTWTAVMQGVERGTLNLDEDINTYLEDSEVTVPDTYDDPVTLRDLGTHTAGFESAIDPDVVADPDAIAPLETVLVEGQPPRVRPPGEIVGYSNYGAALAGHIVAEAYGTTFEEHIQSKTFEPLGMTHSTFAQPIPEDHPGALAAGHTREGRTFRTAEEVFINMRPAGSMTTTASDMAAFMRAHLGAGAVDKTRILSTDVAQTMYERHHVRHPAVTNWRYGFHEYGDPDANLIAHSGATINFTSYLLLAPDHDIGIFVAYNTNAGEHPKAVVDEIVAEYGLQPTPTTPTSTSKLGSQQRAETVAGEYSLTYLPQSGPLQVVDLLEHLTVEPADDGALRTTTLDGNDRRWIETEPYVYQGVGGHDTLAFDVADGDIEVMAMSSQPNGVYEPVPAHERQLVTGSVLGTALSGFGLSLAGWSGLHSWRQWKRYRTDGDPHRWNAE
ncbi:serine hydrolase [Halorubrum sp. F4]|uniref:serine hydrolase domain-containing protein n=1 Tax=Halorubrum sp. F4 TaxID=2989715 RepID=UPI002480DA81|nr:serine hydrolase domain-containing protein [Halorubrum sp. F4]